MPANVCIPLYDDGDEITCKADAALTGKRFVVISNPRVSGPGLATTADGGTYRVNYPSAGGAVLGVTNYDVASGGLVPVLTGPSVLPVTGSGTVTAGQELEVDTTGKVKTLASGKAIGLALNSATDGNDVEVKPYH